MSDRGEIIRKAKITRHISEYGVNMSQDRMVKAKVAKWIENIR